MFLKKKKEKRKLIFRTLVIKRSRYPTRESFLSIRKIESIRNNFDSPKFLIAKRRIEKRSVFG